MTVTKHAAYLTNTNAATSPQANVLFKVPLGKHGEIGTPTTVPIPFFGANGIEATKNGKTLYAVSLTLGTYYKIDTKTGETVEIHADRERQSRQRSARRRAHPPWAHALLGAEPAECGVPRDVRRHRQDQAARPRDDRGDRRPPEQPADPLVNPATADLFGKYIYVVRRNSAPPPGPRLHDGRCDARYAVADPRRQARREGLRPPGLHCPDTYGGDQVSTWSVLRQSCKRRSPVGLLKQPGHNASANDNLALAA